ncbi:glycosyltransferase [Archangium violaceum]|uniref:CgeB family protein n=1 Tax=Archangium violaceum TaxID=83451 RepID=UPI00193C1E6C|nr:glycosyltransferase [Archangium violaceum]QRK12357.1 glycosyltransferase [Archangium violaceum]
MKLVIFGLTVSSSWGNGHATLWRGLISALTGRGHRVVFFERDQPFYASHRDLLELPPGAELVLYSSWEEILPRARLHLRDADAGMVTSYCADGVEAGRLVLGSRVPVKSFYDMDTPVTLERAERGENVEYIGPEGLGDYDIVLSYTGGEALTGLRRLFGARHAVPLYGSVDPRVHFPVDGREHYRADLSYLGTYAANRQQALERLFLEPARRLPERRFVIGGAQYPQDFAWTPNLFFVRHLPPVEHPAFYCSSRLTLNITRAPMAAMGWCPSGRLFEAAACGTPVLSDAWEGLDSFFRPGEELLIAHSTEDAVEALSLSPEELARMGRRARERALTEHTAERRAEELVASLDGARISNHARN